MAELISPPNLDVRSEEQLAAQAIGFTCSAQTVEKIDFQIGVLRELRARVEAGEPAPPVCPELTNANSSAQHTVILETIAWLVGIIARRINRLPYMVQVWFARLFGIELREATKATTTLRFTVAPPPGQSTTIPEGTVVRTADGAYSFETVEELVIPSGTTTGTVEARRDVAGATTLAPNVLTNLYDAVAWVQSVTNLEAVESGTDAESIESALARARNYQRRGERLVSAEDYESAVLDDVLLGSGIVKAFDKIKDGDWLNLDGSLKTQAGHLTLVVSTVAGTPVSGAVKQRIEGFLTQKVGGIFTHVKDPSFVDFSIEADVRIQGLAPQDAVVASVTRKLLDFYAPTVTNFGKSIYQSDIIALIEGSEGVERIIRQPDDDLLALPVDDLEVAPYQMPRLLSVTLNVVS